MSSPRPRPVAPERDVASTAGSAPTADPASAVGSALVDSELVGSVLFVCTGNVCRSPYAQRLLQHFVPGLPVASAGTHALVGAPMDPMMAAELARQGADPGDVRSRQVTASDLAADLIVTMTLAQRSWLLEEHPALVHRVGLLGAVGALARGRQGSTALTRAEVSRWVGTAVSTDAEIPDPYRQGHAAARRTADRLDESVDLLADLLAPVDGVHDPGLASTTR